MKINYTLLIAVVLGLLLLGGLFFFYGGDSTWKLWNVPRMTPSFADTRIITGGCESRSLGYDPLVQNPGDPWGRPMNYPRIWQSLCVLGVDQGATVFIGVAFAILFCGGILLSMPTDIDRVTICVLLCALFSPAIMLGFERGNSDLLIFFMLSLVIYLRSFNSRIFNYAGMAVLIASFILKLYPLFGFVAAFRSRNRAFTKSIVLLVMISVYLLISYKDLALIRLATPKGVFLSFGMNVVPMFITKQFGTAQGDVARVFAYATVALCMILAVAGLRSQSILQSEDACCPEKSLDAFRIGSSIYIGSFLLGNNWDYRLMFLLLTIPQLISFVRLRTRYVAYIAATVLGGILLSLWYLKISHLIGFSVVYFFVDEFATWSVMFGLAYLMAFSAPEWIKCCFFSGSSQQVLSPVTSNQEEQ